MRIRRKRMFCFGKERKLVADNRQLLLDLAILSSLFGKASKDAESFRDELEETENQLVQAREELKRKEEEIKALQELESKEAKFEAEDKALQIEAAELRVRKQDLEAKTIELEGEVQVLRAQVVKLEAEKKDLENRVEKIDDQIQVYRDEIRTAEEQNLALKSQVEAFAVESKDLEKEVARLREQNIEYSTRLATVNPTFWERTRTRGPSYLLMLVLGILLVLCLLGLLFLQIRPTVIIEGTKTETPIAGVRTPPYERTPTPRSTRTPTPYGTRTSVAGSTFSFLDDPNFPKTKGEASAKFGGDTTYWLWEGIQTAGGDIPAPAWQYSGPSFRIHVPQDWRIDFYEDSILHSCGGLNNPGEYGPTDVEASFAVLWFVPGERVCSSFP
ncbi:hypothetical protein C4559_02145 [Candidatus Microgenomates bacterium]|nr:MAG: hypothetical protein C4559_02145 [Candidatus Microgenomates bacterium]